MFLDLVINENERSVSGSSELTFIRRAKSGRDLQLDAVGFQFKALALVTSPKSNKTLKEGADYYYDGDILTVRLGEDLNEGVLKIEYRAVPRLGLYFLAPDKEVPTRPLQVWSQCQDEDGRHWFPCQDKPHVKMTYELRAQVKNGWTVLSGGELHEKKTPKRGPWTFHYRLDVPTPAYLITLVAGQFDEWSESVTLPSKKEIPLRYLVPQGKKADGKRAFDRTARAIELFSRTTGIDYPFNRYSQIVVSDFIFGGMENTTATTMYEHLLIDKKASLDIDAYDLVAHELAHQWFGDLVTCRDWSHAWLNEGFATYFEHVEREDRLGLDEYEHNVTADLNIYLGEARGQYQRAIVCRDYEEPIDLFDRHLYQKGGLVLHMLRRRLGDECFWAGVNAYLEKHRGGIVETNDLMRALEESSGLGLEKFFDQWVYRPGHPDIKVKISWEGEILTVDVEQTQKGHNVAVFELPFEIDVQEGTEVTRHRRLIDECKSSLVVRLKSRPKSVTIDPRYLIAAPIVLSAPADMLKNLLTGGERARARRMAALALGKRQDPDTVEALSRCLSDNKESWMVRAKAAESLGKILGSDAESALLLGSKAQDPKVRRAVTSALGKFRTPAAEEALISLTQDPSYLVTAAAARALGESQSKESVPLLKALLKKSSWSEVVRSAAVSALAELGDEALVPTIIEWTKYGKPLRARRTAIAALSKAGEGKKVRDHLTDMLKDRDPHIRSAVLSALGSLGDAKATAAIVNLLDNELDGGVRTRARDVLSELKKSGLPGLKEAQKENEKLSRELTELKARLVKLEQLTGNAQKSAPSTSKGRRTKRSTPKRSKT